MATERRDGVCHGRRQTGIVFGRALIEGVALRGVKIERATKIYCAPRPADGDQRHCNARSVAACEGGGSPRREPRIRPDIIDPTSFAGPSHNAGWTLTGFHRSPRSPNTLPVIETGCRMGHRPKRHLGIILAVANRGLPILPACHPTVAE